MSTGTATIHMALKLHERGIYTIPICWPVDGQCGCGGGHSGRDIGKAPASHCGKGWQTMVPTRDQVVKWFQHHPDANIGILLEQSNLICLDLDDAAAETECEALGIPETISVVTGSGTRHYYFTNPNRLYTRKTRKGTSGKIDILSKGYVVAPNSLHISGSRYRWASMASLAAPPAWLLKMLDPPKVTPSFSTLPSTYPDTTVEEVQLALDQIDPDANGREFWRNIGLSVHDVFPGQLGFDMWDTWSRQGQKYKQNECARYWAKFVRGGGITKSTLFRAADDANPSWRTMLKPLPSIKVPAKKAPPAAVAKITTVENGNIKWTFGDTVARIKLVVKDGKESDERIEIARRVKPIARTADAESGAQGVVIEYYTPQGQKNERVVPADAWGGDRSAANRFTSEAALAGVRLFPNQGGALAQAIGWWSALAEGAPTRTTVVRPGWHRNSVYVNGSSVHGAEWVYQGQGHRGATKGTLETWKSKVSELATTNGLMLALGVSLSGALIGPLARSGWVLHMCGASTTGKTRAAKLAAGVWYDPGRTATWNGTANGIESTLEGYSGALVVLDEIKEAAPRQVGEIVHRISDNCGRLRSNRQGTGTLRQRTWALTGLSTGETTVGDYLAAHAQGGHMVRCVDLWISRGECTESAVHADKIDEFNRKCFGVAGEAWAKYLVENLDRVAVIEQYADGITEWLVDQSNFLEVDDWKPEQMDAEARRILRQIALAAACLMEAGTAGIMEKFSPKQAEQLVSWAMRKIIDERGDMTSPERRALRSIEDLIESRPALFPEERDLTVAREAVGCFVGGELHTTEGMLKGSEDFRATGISARRFLAWAKENELAVRTPHQSIGNVRGRWWKLLLQVHT